MAWRGVDTGSIFKNLRYRRRSPPNLVKRKWDKNCLKNDAGKNDVREKTCEKNYGAREQESTEMFNIVRLNYNCQARRSARSRLYRSQFSQPNTCWNSYLFEKKIEKKGHGKLLTRSIRFTFLCTSPTSTIQQIFVTNFGDFSQIFK